jgi:hypothetical protein
MQSPQETIGEMGIAWLTLLNLITGKLTGSINPTCMHFEQDKCKNTQEEQ